MYVREQTPKTPREYSTVIGRIQVRVNIQPEQKRVLQAIPYLYYFATPNNMATCRLSIEKPQVTVGTLVPLPHVSEDPSSRNQELAHPNEI